MNRQGILTGGTWCIDRNLLLDKWPNENGRADILESQMSGGGSACNMAIAIRKLAPEIPVATIGLVGDDSEGRFLIAEADANGIDHSQMTVVSDVGTDYTFAFSSLPTGQRTHISFFDSSNHLTPDHFDFSNSTHRFFHLGLPGIHKLMDASWESDENGWVATLRKARSAGLKTNLELASIAAERLSALVRPCLPYLDMLIVNDAEIAGIAGIETVDGGSTDTQTCIEAAKAAMEMGAMDLVAVHFPMGGIVVTRDGSIASRPSVDVPPSEVQGANGAGDAFAAGFLLGVHQGRSVDEALSLAHATAAASLREISTTTAIESWSKCLELADTWGWRESLP